jgi:hypothetical protein
MDGTKTRVCCGRTISECRQHAKKRLSGKDRGLPRWYLKVATVRGASVHGLSGENSFTQAEYEGILAAKPEELAAAARDLEDGSDSEAEVDRAHGPCEARAPTLVNFGGATTFQTPPCPRGSREPASRDYPHRSLGWSRRKWQRLRWGRLGLRTWDLAKAFGQGPTRWYRSRGPPMTVKVHRASVSRPISQLDIPEPSLMRPNGWVSTILGDSASCRKSPRTGV